MKRFIISCCTLLYCMSLYANVIFPFMVMLSRINSVIPYKSIILVAVAIEFIVFLFLFPHKPWYKIAFITLLMNAISALAGFVIYMATDVIFELSIRRFFIESFSVAEMVYTGWFTICTILVNTGIEYWCARLFFQKYERRTLLWAIFIINSASVLFSVSSVGIYNFYFKGA